MRISITKHIKGVDTTNDKKFACIISGSIGNCKVDQTTTVTNWISKLITVADIIAKPTITNRSYTDAFETGSSFDDNSADNTATNYDYKVKCNLTVKKIDKTVATVVPSPNFYQTILESKISTLASDINTAINDAIDTQTDPNAFARINCIFELYK